MKCSTPIRLCGCLWSVLGVLASTPTFSQSANRDFGLVMGIHGSPFARNPLGQNGKLVLMQALFEGEIVSLASGDRLSVCNQDLGSIYELDGPGSVVLGREGAKVAAGSPRIVKTGSCENSAEANEDGGVLLRKLPPQSISPSADH